MKRIATILTFSAIVLPTSMAVADEGWTFNLSPYLWFAGVKGDVSTVPGSPEVPVDVSPSDAIDDTEAGYMVIFGANRGRHGLWMDFLYTDTRSDEDLIKPIDLRLRSVSKNTLFSVAYTYEVYGREATRFDAFAGARYWDVDTRLQFKGGEGLLAGRRIENSESWIDPMVGIKGRSPLGNSSFYLAGWAALGGFGAGSDLFYDLSLNVGYQWTDTIGTTLGYRLFDVDYDEDDFLYDIEQSGVTLGLTWRF